MVVGFYVDVGRHSRPLRKGISALYCGAFAPVPQPFAHHSLFHLVCDDIIAIV